MTMDAKMKSTEGSMKSLKATLAGRIRNITWSTPMARLVTPIGTTSKTHHMPASRKMAIAPWPSRDSEKVSPLGSTAAGNGGLR